MSNSNNYSKKLVEDNIEDDIVNGYVEVSKKTGIIDAGGGMLHCLDCDLQFMNNDEEKEFHKLQHDSLVKEKQKRGKSEISKNKESITQLHDYDNSTATKENIKNINVPPELTKTQIEKLIIKNNKIDDDILTQLHDYVDNAIGKNFQDIKGWSANQWGETFVDKRPYISVEAKELVNRLENNSGQLVAVIGLQGTGKTTLMRLLENVKNLKVKSFSYNGWTMFRDRLGKTKPTYAESEDENGHRKNYQVQTRVDLQEIGFSRNVLFDLRDYDKSRRGDLDKDLTIIEQVWREASESTNLALKRYPKEEVDPIPNFVIFLQEELFKSHFFLGKTPDAIRIQPLKPEEFLQYFKQRFPNNPFEDTAICEIVILARGIWRKIKSYINKCLSKCEKQKITVEDVHKILNVGKLTRDLDLQLMSVFPKSEESRLLAVKIISFLSKERYQEDIIAEFFEGNDNQKGVACSRMLSKLEEAEFVKHLKIGKTKLWKLTIPT